MSLNNSSAFYQLIYVSEPVADLGELFEVIVNAQKFNHSKAISGILILKKSSVLQLIEGPESEVKSLYKRIKEDKRHKNPSIVYEGNSEIRNIPFLGMALTIDYDDEDNIFFFEKKEAIKFSQLIRGPVREYLLTYLDGNS